MIKLIWAQEKKIFFPIPGFKSSAICIRNSFSEAVVRKRQYDKLTMESLDTAEKQDMIKLHEQEPFEAFEERVEEVVDKITDQLEVEEEKARTMLNTLHEILQKHLK